MRLPKDSRYAAHLSRRSVLRGTAGLGLAALIPNLLAACGTGDAEVFANGAASITTTTTAGSEGSGASSTTAAAPSTSAPPTTSPPTSTAAPETTAEAVTTTTTEAEAQATSALPAGSELAIAFTYSPEARGKDLPPYLAVWVEDADGNLVDTIALWYQQDRKGPKWLPDLKRWFNANEARIANGGDEVMSSATRLAGSYTVAWDGTDHTGAPAAPGEYVLAIESARERGPYSIILESVTLAGQPVEAALGGGGELLDASARTV